MPPWYSSWLPGLPSINFSLPATLQGRFISFVLKKTLGHLLKPGQLDSRQIDSQIGSGFVQINDLELDNEAINVFLSDLPVTLYDGCISSVKVRVPWPNPLTSTLGVSLESLHLIFHLQPTSVKPIQRNSNLADSVVSAAESFIHDELTPNEARLWDPLHLSTIPSVQPNNGPNLPGGLDPDPFLSVPEDSLHPDVDPAGVSIFSTLLEGLLARFEFDAINTVVTLVHPGNMSITLSITDIRYRTEDGGDNFSSTPSSQRRSITITGITLTTRDLRLPTPNASLGEKFFSNSTNSPFSIDSLVSASHNDVHPISPSSSCSSLDEEAQFAMSQSLASLPPRPSSAASTMADSIYQSAISTAPIPSGSDSEILPGVPPESAQMTSTHQHEKTVEEETILSFGSSPIVMQLTSRSHAAIPTGAPSSPSVPTSSHNRGINTESLEFSVSIGIIASVLHARTIRGVLDIVNVWSKHSSSLHRLKSPGTSPAGFELAVSIQARGIVGLVPLPSPSNAFVPKPDSSMVLLEYFKRPLVPPLLPYDYFRLHIDGISGYMLPDRVSDNLLAARKPKSENASTLTNYVTAGLSFSDISFFSVYESSTSASMPTSLFASPIILTDRDLTTQYSSPHVHPGKDNPRPSLPTFEVINWTDERFHAYGMKLSLWRTKVNRNQEQAHQVGAGAHSFQKSSGINDPTSALTINMRKKKSPSLARQMVSTNDVEIQAVPLHVFVDLGQALKIDRIMGFLDEASSYEIEEEGDHVTSDIEGVETPPAFPQARSTRAKEKERQRLEKLVLDDLNLDFGYGDEHFTGKTPMTKEQMQRQCQITEKNEVEFSARFDMIRLQIRCPPPHQHLPRSGSLVLDLHGIKLSTTPFPPRHTARFGNDPSQFATEPGMSHQGFVFGAELRRILVSCSPVHGNLASSVFSSGSLNFQSSGQNLGSPRFESSATLISPLHPQISVTKSKAISGRSPPIVAISIEMPSVYVDISKAILSNLQYWADDLTQVIEGISSQDGDRDAGNSHNTNLIGSRFFAKSRSESILSTSAGAARPETVIKVVISKAFFNATIPRVRDETVYTLATSASDVDILLEMKPEGKDETVLTLGIMDVTVDAMQTPHLSRTFLSLTTPHSLTYAPKSMIKFRFTSSVIPETTAKESRVKLTLSGFTFTLFPGLDWISDLTAFSKPPPGTFESVVPSERVSIILKIGDSSIRAFAPEHPGAVVIYVGGLEFSTDVIGDSTESSFRLVAPALSFLALDDASNTRINGEDPNPSRGLSFWKDAGFVLLGETMDLSMNFKQAYNAKSSHAYLIIDRVVLHVHLCADSLPTVVAFVNDLSSTFKITPPEERVQRLERGPVMVSSTQTTGLLASVDDFAFKKLPEILPAPDMINDDLPTNMDYLDESFGTAAGLRELRDDDLDEFDVNEVRTGTSTISIASDGTGITSRIGGETVKMLRPEGIQILDNYFNTLPSTSGVQANEFGEIALRVRVNDGDVSLFLYDGYDWPKTRTTIENEVKEMRRRLARIRQLVANGQAPDSSAEGTSAMLFNSVHIGLEHDVDELEPGAIIAAIDEELKDDIETASQSSWQSLRPPMSGKGRSEKTRVHGKRLTRSKSASMEFRLMGLKTEVDHYRPNETHISRTLITVRNVEILDHIKTSTWKMFLTELRSDSRGNIRETDSDMVRIELRNVHSVPGHASQEARLRAKILPLRLYVDQDAVDFLKKFFSFKDHNTAVATDTNREDVYFQLAEVFPVLLKLDYKPRRVDYRALREGRTIELMNFFHFDGAEMTLRHITLAGITGWPRLFELLNDLWTPDVKATQLVEVISGVAPIRSVVNVGSGVADLVLLPIAQYKKDGRIVRGLQKGTTAFVKSTATEAIKLGARLAMGTQVILEQAEGVLGGQFQQPVTAETVQGSSSDDFGQGSDENDESGDISKYAQQPGDLREGIQSAYKSLRKNLSSAAQTILAVPMEVYERSENEGPVRAVIRAVPIAVLKPMIGASEAVSKTLLGLHNSLDPDVRHDNEDKYKRR